MEEGGGKCGESTLILLLPFSVTQCINPEIEELTIGPRHFYASESSS